MEQRHSKRLELPISSNFHDKILANPKYQSMTYKNIPFLFILFFSNLLVSVDFEVNDAQRKMLETLPPDQRTAVMLKMQQAGSMQEDIEEVFEKESFLIERPEYQDLQDEEKYCKECIYGYNIFRFAPSSYSASNVVPLTSTYTLGPGDEIEVTYYGNLDTKKKEKISKDGTFVLPSVGPVNLGGLTYEEAKELIEKNVESSLLGTRVSVSVGSLRSITVYLLGESYKPGSYTLSAMSNVSNALFISGGVSKLGSLRNIEVRRNGKIKGVYDFYDFLLKGDTSSGVKLEDGDAIFIPFIQNKVKLNGSFRRPGNYEIVEGESLKEAIAFAGGYKSEVVNDSVLEISYIDKSKGKRVIEYFSKADVDTDRELGDGDSINISHRQGLLSKSIELSGEFKNPGVYSILPGDRVLDIIVRAGGYTDEAYAEGTVFLRKQVAEKQKEGFSRSAEELERTMINIISSGQIPNISEFTLAPLAQLIARLRNEDPIGRQVVNFDYLTLKSDPSSNIYAQDEDEIFIPRRPESIYIVGEVLNSTTLRFDPENNVQDYIRLAGGLNDQADKNRMYVIYPNGSAEIINNSFFRNSASLIPGSTIVVSRDSRAFDIYSILEVVTPIFADLATSAAAIAAISD